MPEDYTRELELGALHMPRSSVVEFLAGEVPAVKSGMCGHERVSSGKDEWLTPKEITDVLGPFDLDPCSPIQRPWATAKQHFTVEDDGLKQPWFGRVWLNPPYGNETEKWVWRLAQHGNGICLIFARTETATWFDSVWPVASALLFIKGRIAFCHVDGRRAGTSAGAPSCLIAYGRENAERLKTCGIPGAFVDLGNYCKR